MITADHKYFIITIVFILGVVLSPFNNVNRATAPLKEPVLGEQIARAPREENPFLSLPIQAEAVYVYDIAKQKVLYEKRSDQQLPLASLTKIATVITALSLMGPETEIKIDSVAMGEEGDSGLSPDERWDLKSIAQFTLMASSNDGARAIARTIEQKTGVVFEREMNKIASETGLHQTYFVNPTGLDESSSISGGYGSARDVAHLFSYGIKKFPDVFDPVAKPGATYRSLDGILHEIENTNTETKDYPALISSKTGFTDLAGGNLVIAFDVEPAHPVVVVVLGSTREGRFADADLLSLATIQLLTNDVPTTQ